MHYADAGRERWHGRGIAVEVIPAHAIEDEQHDHPWSSESRRKTGNTRPVVVGGICTPSAAASVGATSCCAAGIQ